MQNADTLTLIEKKKLTSAPNALSIALLSMLIAADMQRIILYLQF